VGNDSATAEIDPDVPAVNILTIHKAKGLEFRVVFLVSLLMHKFPLSNRRKEFDLPDELIKDILPEHNFHLQEERRLFYVGITRAKEKLFLTSARDYGGKRSRKISQFVLEALDMSIKISKDELLRHFDSAFVNEGFLTREHEELTREQGKKSISLFFDKEEQSGKIPTYIEKRFSFLLDKDKISGRWDRVDVDEDGSTIIDFKSSKVINQEQADKRTKESLQLSIYALAYKNIFGKIPKKIGLYFLETCLLGSYSHSEEDLKKFGKTKLFCLPVLCLSGNLPG